MTSKLIFKYVVIAAGVTAYIRLTHEKHVGAVGDVLMKELLGILAPCKLLAHSSFEVLR